MRPLYVPDPAGAGATVGVAVGRGAGDETGAGATVGVAVGRAVAVAVGAAVGVAVGAAVGVAVGRGVAVGVGAAVGVAVGDGAGAELVALRCSWITWVNALYPFASVTSAYRCAQRLVQPALDQLKV